MQMFAWDGPDDSDEEIPELIEYKADFENKLGIKYSKNGIIEFIENLIERESR